MMCGRFALGIDNADLQDEFPDFEFPQEISPRYNIAPSQNVAVVPNDGQARVTFFRWGLIPFWAKDPSIGNRMINARAETAAEKPSFRAAYKRRRCLILANGFYEWRKEAGSRAKTPMFIQLKDRRPFAFAGLWELWRPDESPIYSCTIITTKPNSLLVPIHNRMPVILPREAYERWLNPEEQRSGAFDDLLKPYPPDLMTAYAVSRFVNSPKNDSPACIVPAEI